MVELRKNPATEEVTRGYGVAVSLAEYTQRNIACRGVWWAWAMAHTTCLSHNWAK